MKSFIKFLPLIMWGVACSVKAPTPSVREFNFGNRRPIVAAHRAEHSSHSENSLEAIQSAKDKQIPLIEMDIRSSTNGVLYLFHNRNIDPQTIKGTSDFLGRPFSSLSATQINSLILPFGEHIPTFEEVIAQKNSPSSSLLLDIKGAELREKVINIIGAHHNDGRYWFLCYDVSCISQVQNSHLPGAEIIARINLELSIEQGLSFNPKIVQFDCDSGCEQKVAKIKSKNPSALLLATTLEASTDNEDTWRSYMEKGIDIILTDQPLKLKLFQSR